MAGKPHAITLPLQGCQAFEVRRLVALAAIGRDGFVTEIIGEDEDDVWFAICGGCETDDEGENKAAEKVFAHAASQRAGDV